MMKEHKSPTLQHYLCEGLGLGGHDVLKVTQLTGRFVRTLDPLLQAAQVHILERTQAQTWGVQLVGFISFTVADTAHVLPLRDGGHL